MTSPHIEPRVGEPTNLQRAALREAMRLHARDEVDAAIVAAETLVESVPDFCEAHAYLGNTLVTRKRRFADGLAALQSGTVPARSAPPRSSVPPPSARAMRASSTPSGGAGSSSRTRSRSRGWRTSQSSRTPPRSTR